MGTGLAIAAGVGVLIVIQVGLMGPRTATISPLVVSMLVHVGGLTAAVAWLTIRRSWEPVVEAAGGWWWVAAGLAGWLIVAGLGAAAGRAGVAATLAVAVTVQLGVGMAWDATTGEVPIDLRGVAGLVLLALGAFLVAGRA